MFCHTTIVGWLSSDVVVVLLFSREWQFFRCYSPFRLLKLIKILIKQSLSSKVLQRVTDDGNHNGPRW